MKTQEEIEQLAEKYATSIYGFSNENYNDYFECKRHCIEFYSQCQEDNKDEYRWTYSEIFDACFPTLGRGGDWAAIAKRLIEQKENK